LPRRYRTLHDAYLDNLGMVYERPQYRSSPRGNGCRERLNGTFIITRPRERVCFSSARRPNIVFHFAEALWYLACSDELEHIAYYAPSMRHLVPGSTRLMGTAYGPRIFGADRYEDSQWQRVRRLLGQDDPDSKRACIQVFDSAELAVDGNADVACTLGLQFLLRSGRLHLTAYMRGNDAFRGALCDIFSFTLLQELMARSLGVELGDYCHVVGSMHVNDVDVPRVEAVLSEWRLSGARFTTPAFPAMPPGDNMRFVPIVVDYEHELRTAPSTSFPPAGKQFGELPAYWQQVLLLFAIYRGLTREGETNPALTGQLWPVYRHLLGLRWPQTKEIGGTAAAG
jgi:thymidylate synthase